MIKDLINETAQKYILEDVELSCRRLGINAKFQFTTEESYYGEPYDTIESTSFQTMPMLFKEIHLCGDACATDNDNDVKVIVHLEYKYKTFDGGYNSSPLGTVAYVVDKSYNGKNIEKAHLYIDKVKSLNI